MDKHKLTPHERRERHMLPGTYPSQFGQFRHFSDVRRRDETGVSRSHAYFAYFAYFV